MMYGGICSVYQISNQNLLIKPVCGMLSNQSVTWGAGSAPLNEAKQIGWISHLV